MWESERVETSSEKILRTEYTSACRKYENLAKNLKQALELFLHDEGIDVLDVQYRIKEFDSFQEKNRRKVYKDPLNDTEDICGLRIICYYPSDLNKISELIKSEFDVLEFVDKADLLEPDKFGYRSLHFIVTVKKDWLNAPNYRGLDGLKAEIQIRTVLMHAWADIEHKLAYKKKEYVPDILKRKLSRLSAAFEEADERLDSLQKEREEYKENLTSEIAKQSGRFDITQKLNIDSLQAFLDFYFADREKITGVSSKLLDELTECDISMKDLVEGYEKVKIILPDIIKDLERARFGDAKDKAFIKAIKPGQVGIVRYILDITNDDYWRYRKQSDTIPFYAIPVIDKWRKILLR